MAKIPAICSHCGLNFSASRIIGGSGSGNIVFDDCGIICPNCGKVAEIPSGTYTIKDGVTSYFKSNHFSRSELQTLSRIIKEAQEKDISADDLSKIIDKEIPKASGLKKFFGEGINFMSVLSVILSVISIYLAVKFATTTVPQNEPRTTISRRQPEKPTKREVRRNRGRSKQMPPHKPNKKQK